MQTLLGESPSQGGGGRAPQETHGVFGGSATPPRGGQSPLPKIPTQGAKSTFSVESLDIVLDFGGSVGGPFGTIMASFAPSGPCHPNRLGLVAFRVFSRELRS